MFNKEKQIEYWKLTGLSDYETAELLIEKGKILHGLFFCHLTIEKLLKAHFVKTLECPAPKTHDLIYLSKKANIIFNENHQALLVILMQFQLEGRYPDNLFRTPSSEQSMNYLKQTKELVDWLTLKL